MGIQNLNASNSSEVIAILPARGGSKGIPRKNLIPFCERPLLGWSIEQCLKSEKIHKTFVTSDSDEILSFAEKQGAYPILRPDSLSQDHSTSESALLHALDVAEKEHVKTVSAVVFLQPTSPLRLPTDIDQALTQFEKSHADSLFSGTPLADCFIWEQTDQGPRSVTYDFSNRKIRQDIQPQYLENGSIYIFKPSLLRTQNNRLGGKIEIFAMQPWQRYEIDEPEDIELCEWHFKRYIL